MRPLHITTTSMDKLNIYYVKHLKVIHPKKGGHSSQTQLAKFNGKEGIQHLQV